jgi:hypothetical protein
MNEMMGHLDRQIEEHRTAVRSNFIGMAAKLAVRNLREEHFDQDVRELVNQLELVVGEQHSRLAQMRSLRWMRKQLRKDMETQKDKSEGYSAPPVKAVKFPEAPPVAPQSV